MRTISFVFSFLAWAGQGRRTHTSFSGLSKSPRTRTLISQELNQLKAFRELLQDLVPTAAWQTAGAQPVHHSAGCRSNRVGCSLMKQSDHPMADKDFKAVLKRFAPKSDIPELREKVAELEDRLKAAVERQDFALAARLRDEIQEVGSRDSVQFASTVRARLEAAVKDERYAEAATFRDQLRAMRPYQQEFQLAGLWVGTYPDNTETVVRIDYRGDILIATKVDGDGFVPAGQVTFEADLSKLVGHETEQTMNDKLDVDGEYTQVVNLKVMAVTKDGKYAEHEADHFEGQGRVASSNFESPHFVPGQLYILDDDIVGFLWLPLGQFVLFNRMEDVPDKEVELFPDKGLGH